MNGRGRDKRGSHLGFPTPQCLSTSSFWEYFSSLNKVFSFLFQTMCLIHHGRTQQSRFKCPLNSHLYLSLPKCRFPGTLNFFPVFLNRTSFQCCREPWPCKGHRGHGIYRKLHWRLNSRRRSPVYFYCRQWQEEHHSHTKQGIAMPGEECRSFWVPTSMPPCEGQTSTSGPQQHPKPIKFFFDPGKPMQPCPQSLQAPTLPL